MDSEASKVRRLRRNPSGLASRGVPHAACSPLTRYEPQHLPAVAFTVERHSLGRAALFFEIGAEADHAVALERPLR